MVEENKAPFISVIIPTYRDWSRLQLCLNALEKQTYPKDSFEIIVVNNAPSDRCPATIYLPANCFLTEEKKPGSYAARNKGTSYAKGEIFCFTDADCIPSENWLQVISLYYKDSKGILSGQVRMFSTINEKKLNFAESYDYIFGINQEIYAEKKESATANLSVTASEFFLNNGFRGDMMSGGDVDFCNRAKAKGITFCFSNKVVVAHPLRNRLSDLTIKSKRLIGGKLYQNKVRGILLAFSPPLIRLNILFFKKKAPALVKLKCFIVIFYIKFIQSFEAVRVFFGAKNVRL